MRNGSLDEPEVPPAPVPPVPLPVAGADVPVLSAGGVRVVVAPALGCDPGPCDVGVFDGLPGPVFWARAGTVAKLNPRRAEKITFIFVSSFILRLIAVEPSMMVMSSARGAGFG